MAIVELELAENTIHEIGEDKQIEKRQLTIQERRNREIHLQNLQEKLNQFN